MQILLFFVKKGTNFQLFTSFIQNFLCVVFLLENEIEIDASILVTNVSPNIFIEPNNLIWPWWHQGTMCNENKGDCMQFPPFWLTACTFFLWPCFRLSEYREFSYTSMPYNHYSTMYPMHYTVITPACKKKASSYIFFPYSKSWSYTGTIASCIIEIQYIQVIYIRWLENYIECNCNRLQHL